ncbi:hypothetical protein CASFOL_018971 [Castilleja foliolosa]|uniref:DUF7950 domain-containing protein n=1 Tax=Castilleja foliolosa TaxID=1961234 RepID=A0ABD3D3V7_9LAMI
MRRSSDCQSVVNRIMLRFRPIAPKPLDVCEPEKYNKDGAWRRTKRKYVRIRGRQGKTKDEKNSPPPLPENSSIEDESSPEKLAVTLQLLPERPDTSPERSNNITDPCNYQVTAEICGEGSEDIITAGTVVETTIIVDLVTVRFGHDEVGLGFSDEEIIYRLKKDTCPGFISDWTNKVIWVNEAYKNMVMAVEDGETSAAEKGFLVYLEVKDELPRFYPSFACRVRVIQRSGQGQKWNKIVPCDVWRMEFDRFAWRLDVNTALSLSL